VGVVVAVAERRAIGEHDAGDLPHVVIGEARGRRRAALAAADRHGLEPAAGRVAERGLNAVLVDHGERPAGTVVAGDLRLVAERVGDRGDEALLVVIEAGDVRDVGARPVDRAQELGTFGRQAKTRHRLEL
jgi:hypothetical protein